MTIQEMIDILETKEFPTSKRLELVLGDADFPSDIAHAFGCDVSKRVVSTIQRWDSSPDYYDPHLRLIEAKRRWIAGDFSDEVLEKERDAISSDLKFSVADIYEHSVAFLVYYATSLNPKDIVYGIFQTGYDIRNFNPLEFAQQVARLKALLKKQANLKGAQQ